MESFFLHQNPNHSMQYINFLLGRNCYRDINLYFTYDTQYSNSLQQKLIFFIEEWLK